MKPFRSIVLPAAIALTVCALLVILVWPGFAQAPQPQPQPQALDNSQAVPFVGFTYQGRLTSNAQPHNGVCDFIFATYDTPSAGAIKFGPGIAHNVTVSNGLFTIQVSMSTSISDAQWLEMDVRCPAGSGPYTKLTGRTQITAVPLASTLRYGSTIRPATGGNVQTNGLTVYTDAQNAGFTNPVAIVGVAAQTTAGQTFTPPTHPTGILGVSAAGDGVRGVTSSPFIGSAGVVGMSLNSGGAGVIGENYVANGIGVAGHAPNGSIAMGVKASSIDGWALYATSSAPCCIAAARITNTNSAVALWAVATNQNAGIFSQGGSGIVGEAIENGGVGVIGRLASGISGLAGQFLGNIDVTGAVLAPILDMHIDHPQDPTQQYLNQAAMYAPEMMNVYSGNAVTDDNGYAYVKLPGYIEALNTDFRYQLTVVGQFAQAIVSSKISSGVFVIQTDKPNVEVSWQVSGVRQDAYALANPMTVEQDKPAAELGLYLHPSAFGMPSSLGAETIYRQMGRVDESGADPRK